MTYGKRIDTTYVGYHARCPMQMQQQMHVQEPFDRCHALDGRWHGRTHDEKGAHAAATQRGSRPRAATAAMAEESP
ncbi:hypothetical protein Sar04_48900 [Salinispora arenicola]|uniref:Uncharacterized protein n=1 Tax=Salinispora arenicola TaxID=168697 RepID=A0ABQ4K144_SALAC|nr:hypothetical protein Sar04_48900 [Salinispora arenicola]